jgi:predicted glycosyltransferase
MLYCQYLSGMGHLVRTTQFAKALAERFQPTVVIGGPKIEGFVPPDGVEIVYMPPLWLQDGAFRVADGSDVDEIKRTRRDMLIDLFESARPEIVITEFFPFGRHDLLFELEPWMQHIKTSAPETLVVSSLRDLIGKTVLNQQTGKIAQLANAYFDAVLVHADPQFLRFESTFAGAPHQLPDPAHRICCRGRKGRTTLV